MKVGGLDFISFISMFIPVVVILISIVLGYLFNKKLELNKEINSKKRKIYEDFLAAITLVLFEGGLTLLIDPSKEYPMKEVHETKISVINGYEKIKLWGSEGVVNAMAKRTGNSDDNKEVIRLLNVIANKSTVIEMDHRLVGKLTAKSVKNEINRYDSMVRRANGFR